MAGVLPPGMGIGTEDEHRQRQKGIPFHQLHSRRKSNVKAAFVTPKQQCGDHSNKPDGPEHALSGQQHQHHG
jgi:hypothetical protein